MTSCYCCLLLVLPVANLHQFITMKPLNLVSFLSFLTILSSLAHLVRLPDEEEVRTNKRYNPFSLIGYQVSSKHREMLMKLRKLHLAKGNQQRYTSYIIYISILLVTLSNDVELNPGPRPSKYPCGSCGAAVRYNQNSIQRDGCNFWYHIE